MVLNGKRMTKEKVVGKVSVKTHTHTHPHSRICLNARKLIGRASKKKDCVIKESK